MSFAERLDALLAERGLSQKELARALKTTQQRVSIWKQASGGPSRKSLEKLASFFGVSVDSLLDHEGPPRADPITAEERLFLAFVREVGYEDAMRAIARSLKGRPIPQPEPKAVGDSGATPKGKRGAL